VEELLAAIRRGEPPSVLAGIVHGWARESMVDRLGRIADQVRRLGRAAGKGEVRVFTEPNDLRLDGEVWASFWSALVHVLRNAVDHGIEAPEERAAAGKLHPPTIVVRTFIAGDRLVIEVADDGRGVAWEKIAAKAREAGLPAETQEHLVAALFSDGLSTGDGLTELSGRGVGAGAVRVECEARGGRVEVRSERGRGTTFSFIFPMGEARRRNAAAGLGMSL
jgi:two-component system chemotaxis sensor kinase CheA